MVGVETVTMPQLRCYFLVLLCIFTAQVLAAGDEARIVFLRGNVTAVSEAGTPRLLRRGSHVTVGDTIKTGAKGLAQLMFSDKSLLYVKAASELQLMAFHFADKTPENDNQVINLVKGGMRALSGSLGKRSADKVEYRTRFSTIGIRGTAVDIAGVGLANGERITFDLGFGDVRTSAGSLPVEAGISVLITDLGSMPRLFEYVPPRNDPAFIVRTLARLEAAEVQPWILQNQELFDEGQAIFMVALIAQMPGSNDLSLNLMRGLQQVLSPSSFNRVLQNAVTLRPDLASAYLRNSVQQGGAVSEILRAILSGMQDAPRNILKNTIETAAELGISTEDARDIIAELKEKMGCE